jgi:shikimate kinase
MVLRKAILERDGWLCQCDDCKSTGAVKVAHEVDHKSNTRDENDRLNDSPDNLQAINRDCHKRKTARESLEGAQRSSMTPEWMPVTTKPLTVVCGPPGSGKTTWAKEQASLSDLVIDQDDIATDVFLKPLWEMLSPERQQVARLRNEMIASYVRGKTTHTHCYLIDTAGSFKRRKFWRDRGADVVVMETVKDECFERVRKRADRPESVKPSLIKAIERWN